MEFMKLNMLECYISADVIPVSIKTISFETYSGELFESHFTSVTFSRVNSKYLKMTALYHQGCQINPDELKFLTSFIVLDKNKNPIQLKEVKSITAFGEDERGYSIAKPVKVPEHAEYLLPHVVEYRHIVVTGVHGNFKNKERANARANFLKLHQQDAKVIKVKV